ncbi:agglutination protein [Streptomyces nanshensis]|uniref:Agglutination protein n=2 Tax=Streptomyces nanshensis TaxID=518642 RepID=A0A1E7KWT7_9ACTN|nr:agglutination protein [Streptomyces nanshensis]
MTLNARAQELGERMFTRGHVTSLVGQEVHAEEWKVFSESWHRLPVDAFMADGEKYRLRRHTVFNVNSDSGIEQLPPRPYVQTLDINHLNGDVRRSYDGIERPVTGSRFFRSLLLGLSALLDELQDGPCTWHHQCFQNRITTSGSEVGNPTPEGVHRDGVDYVLTMIVDRHNITGGCSGIYEASTRKPLHSETLTEPGSFLLADDERTRHDATSVFPLDPALPAHRDVFIDVITRGTQPR